MSATIIIYQSLVQFLRSKYENSKDDISSYTSKQSIEYSLRFYQSLVQFLRSRHENSKDDISSYTSKQSIEVESNSARISNYSEGFQR